MAITISRLSISRPLAIISTIPITTIVHEDPVGFCECSLRHDHNRIRARRQQTSCHIHVQCYIHKCNGQGCIHIHGQPGRHGQKQLHIHDHIHIRAQPQLTSCQSIHTHHSVHEDPEDSCVCSCCLHKDG